MRHLRAGLFVGFLVACSSPAWSQPPAGKPIEGTLTIGKKTYKLTSVAVYETKWFDMQVTNVMACDKAIPVDKLKQALAKDGADDSFSLWEPNIRVTFGADGKPMSMNAWADNHSLSISGGSLSGELTVKDGAAQGSFKMPPDAEAGNGCEFTFAAPMIRVAPANKPEQPKDKDVADAPRSRPMPGSVLGQSSNLSVYSIPLPKDAANVEYKTLVEQFTFTSPTDHMTLAKSFGNQLAAVGWKKDEGELVSKASAILKRKQGEAELTIFIKPTDKGSTVLIMSEGLNWEKPASKGAAKP